ncbi:MAG: Nif3-like dinuclear metal center hexameric protein [Desulfuromonadales bacterium]|nr:Nif3-like dinuclear metal center hexameric protein [Desulfuromonadales bacterium]
MILPKLSDLIGIINKIAPTGFTEEWDNSGLQVGDPGATIKKVMIALDPGAEAVEEAIKNSCQLLLTHHPLIFTSIKSISAQSYTGSLLYKIINNNLSVFSIHTNYDIAENGVNDLLARKLNLQESEPLLVTGEERFLKLTLFVPTDYTDRVLNAVLPFAVNSDKYRECSYRTKGFGTFSPVQGAKPFIGEIGKRETVEEERIELLVRESDKANLQKALLAAHPYEEPAFDFISVEDKGICHGLGRIGRVSKSFSVEEFARFVKQALDAPCVRAVGDMKKSVSKIAVCSGSGMSLLKDAIRQGADLFVTGDIKYHEARNAEAAGIALIDAGHFATEKLMIEGLVNSLKHELSKTRFKLELIPFSKEQDPFKII